MTATAEGLEFVDSHCHLTHDRFAEDLPAVLDRSAGAGVGRVVAIASDEADARAARAIARQSVDGGAEDTGAVPTGPSIWFTAGVHPHEAGAGILDAGDLEELLADPLCVAVGECGLDFHYDFAPPEAQYRVFEEQIGLAESTGLPLVVHCRDAEEQMIPRVKAAGNAGVMGVLHCFPGDMALLEAAMEAGWSVSFTGLVTFRSFDGEEAVRVVPSSRYFVETDGPYMAPVPHRGHRNEPAFVPDIAAGVARIRGESLADVAGQTTRNAEAFFSLPHR